MRHHILKLLAVTALVTAISTPVLAASESTGQYIDDATLTTKVKAAIVADKQLKAMQISVETNKGVVQLTGAVDTKSQESEAIKVANQVDGVQDVKDEMTVRGSQSE